MMPQIDCHLLIGQYAQAYYLGKKRKKNLTTTVQAYEEYLPHFWPIPHPSPLNLRWLRRNPWFEAEVVPRLQAQVARLFE